MITTGSAILKRLGYRVETRTDSKEALDLFRLNPSRFDLIITDMTMPRMMGTQMAKEMLKIEPDIPIILCTGFSEKINSQGATEIGIKKYIEKPLNTQELGKAIREVLDEKAAN